MIPDGNLHLQKEMKSIRNSKYICGKHKDLLTISTCLKYNQLPKAKIEINHGVYNICSNKMYENRRRIKGRNGAILLQGSYTTHVDGDKKIYTKNFKTATKITKSCS